MNGRVFVLLWLISLFSLGLLFFTRGFLLKRIVLPHKNQCNLPPDKLKKTLDKMDEISDGSLADRKCWLPHSFAKAVFIVIDGLRYDFARWNDSVTNALPFQNKLLTINQVLKNHPEKSRLFKFLADAPTTTIQRIKGLTTGSLPTFIDMGASFASYEIDEDNFIDQLVNNGKKIVFMGDDTWTSLYPNRFHALYPFPSFNTKDLDTVDNGILQQLIPTIKNDEWDVIIAHFLGVDHCGHTYGPNHPIMGQKLNQLDLILKSVVSNLRDDTVLFVMGDHGMSWSGNHGGDSVDEVTSALFVYNGGRVFEKSTTSNVDQVVNQIDLVPTVSLLLGVPIPFGNLGSVISELIPRRLVPFAYFVNILQVNEYLSKYISVADDFSSANWLRLQMSFNQIIELFDSLSLDHDDYSSPDVTRFVNLTSSYLHQSLSMCRHVWATFHLFSMLVGVIFISLALFVAFWMSSLSLPADFSTRSFLFLSSISLFSLVSLIFLPIDTDSTSVLSFFLSFSLLSLVFFLTLTRSFIRSYINQMKPSLDSILSSFLILILSSSVFSNSFIINEASSLSFLTNFCLTLLSFSTIPTPQTQKTENARSNHQMCILISLILLSTISRLSLHLQRCRSEQFWCVDLISQISSSSSPTSTLSISIICICAIPISILHFLRRAGNLNGNSTSVLTTKYLSGICCACICYFWALSSLPVKLRQHLSSWQEIWFPRFAFACLFVEIISVIFNPLFLYFVSHSDASRFPDIPTSSIPELFNYFKSNWRRHFTLDQAKNLPLVYGLATVYSASVLVVILIISLLSCLLLGQFYSLSFLFLLSSLFISLTLVSVKKTEETRQISNIFHVPWSHILIWSMQSSFFFFATGHQSTISSIHWNSAFVGAEKVENLYFIAAFKVLLNTFASHVVFSFGLQLLILWPFTCHVLFPSIGFKGAMSEQVRQGEMSLYYHQDEFTRESFRCTVKFIFVRGLSLLASMLAASIHRRHLMVWELFAPRFIFESISFIFCVSASCASLAFISRTNSALDDWMKKLEKRT